MSERKRLFEALRPFRASWVSRGWSWDRRFDCVASTFDVTLTEQARAAADQIFGSEWTHRTVGNAPEIIRDIADRTGGVRSDQIIMASEPAGGIIAFGLWWPWGGEGSNISMRVGLAGAVDGGDIIDFRDLFGALDD